MVNADACVCTEDVVARTQSERIELTAQNVAIEVIDGVTKARSHRMNYSKCAKSICSDMGSKD